MGARCGVLGEAECNFSVMLAVCILLNSRSPKGAGLAGIFVMELRKALRLSHPYIEGSSGGVGVAWIAGCFVRFIVFVLSKLPVLIKIPTSCTHLHCR
jgi:hypothetical protein